MEGREESREEGHDAARRETALNLLRLTGHSDTEIAAVTGLRVAPARACAAPVDALDFLSVGNALFADNSQA